MAAEPSPVTSLLMYGCTDISSGAYSIILKSLRKELCESGEKIAIKMVESKKITKREENNKKIEEINLTWESAEALGLEKSCLKNR